MYRAIKHSRIPGLLEGLICHIRVGSYWRFSCSYASSLPLVPADTPSHLWLLWTVGYAPGIVWMSNTRRTVSWLPFVEGSQTCLRHLTRVDSHNPVVPWSLKGTPSGFSRGVGRS
jgi:hypothetical protein